MSSPSDVTHWISANYLDTLKEADVSVSIGMKDVLQYWINWQGKQRKISEQSSVDAWDDTLITVSSVPPASKEDSLDAPLVASQCHP